MPMHHRQHYAYQWFNGRSGNNPLDSTDYYLGCIPVSNWSTTPAVQKIHIIKEGRIRRAGVWVFSSVATTAEDWTMKIRLNDTTDYDIATVGTATAEKWFYNSNMNIPVVAGDFIEFKTTTPAWVTNPTNVLDCLYLIVEGAL